MRHKLLAACAALVVGGMVSMGSAAPVPVVNGNFDQCFTDSSMTTSYPVVNGMWTQGLGSTDIEGPYPGNTHAFVPGWTNTPFENVYGSYHDGLSPVGGVTLAYMTGGSSIMQTLTTNVAADTTYTLAFQAYGTGGSSTLTASLLAGGAPLTVVSTPTTAINATWQSFSYTFSTGGAVDSSQPLAIQFTLPGGPQTYVTGVSLDATVVPEPATAAVLGLGSLGLLLRRRK